MSKLIKNWQILAIILTLLFGGGVFAFRSIQLKKQSVKNQIQTLEEKDKLLENQDPTADWETYLDEENGFSFKHPNLDTECCTMGGPASELINFSTTFTDTDTLDPEVVDRPFAGIGVYVIETNKPFDKYIADEKKALLEQEKDYLAYMSENDENFNQEFEDNGTEKEVTLNDQKGIILINYTWDDIERYYIPLPNLNKILVIGKSSAQSQKFTFDQIFETFKIIPVKNSSVEQ